MFLQAVQKKIHTAVQFCTLLVVETRILLGVTGRFSQYRLEQTGTSTDAVCLQRRSDRQTDGLLRARSIGHDEISGERIQSSLYTLHRGEERLQVDGYIGTLYKIHQTNKFLNKDYNLSNRPFFLRISKLIAVSVTAVNFCPN
ncbi:hypothetical protein EVA_17768 [gut metagenome]|uniref:Uncharacterized protein n=1 Tax=gut metagenome TaxID=749906 RepID=J9C2U0_9ZZZZ